MVSVLINGEFLDIEPTTEVTIRRRHNLYDGSDPTIKRGSYTLPFAIPLTDRNKRLLGDPHIKDNRNQLLIDEPVWLYLSDNLNYGLPYLKGKLYVSDSTDLLANVSIITSALTDFGDDKFDDVEMGGPPEFSSSILARNVAKATVEDPDSFDYAFIPVYNSEFTSLSVQEKIVNYSDFARINIQNAWNNATGAFYDLQDRRDIEIVTPFIKVTYLLHRIFDHIGVSLENDIDDAVNYPELSRLYLHHVNNLQVNGDWPLKINYNDMLPDMKLADFYKQYASMFFLGIFPDPVANKVRMRLWKDVLRAEARYDWSDKVRDGYSISGASSLPDSIRYKIDSADDQYVQLPSDTDQYVDVIDAYPTGYERIYSVIDGSYHFNDGNYDAADYTVDDLIYGDGRKIRRGYEKQYIGGVADGLVIEMTPLLSFAIDNGTNKRVMPICSKRGAYRRYIYVDHDAKDINGETVDRFGPAHHYEESQSRATNARIILYRGMKDIGEAYPAPYANMTAYDPDTEMESYNYSLQMGREKGLINNLGAEVLHFIANHKKITKLIDMDMNDLMNLQEDDIVRVDNMRYLISEYEIVVGVNGIVDAAQVTLASV